MDDDRLPIEDDLTGDIQGAGNHRKAFGLLCSAKRLGKALFPS
jgi:hypothetical protein